MPIVFIYIFSVFIYAILFWALKKREALFDLRGWPEDQGMFRIWAGWLIFLLIITPLSHFYVDMLCWVTSIQNLLKGQVLPSNYVYLPVFAMFQAAIALPFSFFSGDSRLLAVYVVHINGLIAYAYSPKLLAAFLPDQKGKAGLAIVLAPVTIFYLFFGGNHIIMFFLLFLSLLLIKQKKWMLAGVLAGLSCYKFMMAPVVLLLAFIVLFSYGLKNAGKFVLGAVLSLIPSLIYYIFEPSRLSLVLGNFAALGGNSNRIEQFHFLYYFSQLFPGLTDIYIGNKIWLYLSGLGALLGIFLFKKKLVNSFQAMAVCYAITTIAAPETYRLEPLIALLWLDALQRKSLRAQTWIWAILLVHAAAWFDLANFRFLTYDEKIPSALWLIKGTVLGMVVMTAVTLQAMERGGKDLLAGEDKAGKIKSRVRKIKIRN